MLRGLCCSSGCNDNDVVTAYGSRNKVNRKGTIKMKMYDGAIQTIGNEIYSWFEKEYDLIE